MRKTCKNVSSFVGKRFNRFFSAVEVEGGGGRGAGEHVPSPTFMENGFCRVRK